MISKESHASTLEILKYIEDSDIEKSNQKTIEIKASIDSKKEKEFRKSSNERDKIVEKEENENNIVNSDNLLNSNKNSVLLEREMRSRDNCNENESKTNINVTIKTSNFNSIPKQSDKVTEIKKSSQNDPKSKDKYVSAQHYKLPLANGVKNNFTSLGKNPGSRSISKSKDSIILSKDKKLIGDFNSIKQIGVSICNSKNENIKNDLKNYTNLSTFKFPKSRCFKTSNMLSKVNTRLKNKIGSSPDDINLKREIKNDIFYPTDDNIKPTNHLEFNHVLKQTESLSNKIKTFQNREKDKKLPNALNKINSKSDFDDKKYPFNLKNSSQKLPDKLNLSKNLKLVSNCNSNSKYDTELDKKISQTNSLGNLPYDAKLNHKNSFTEKGKQITKETGNSRSKLNPNQPSRMIDLTFGTKETTTGRFMSERVTCSSKENCENEKVISELFNEVKLNLDGNMKNIFNFSYENFNNENSDSIISYIKTDDSDISEGRKDESVKVNYDINEIGFDHREEILKNKLFKNDTKY